MKKNLKKIIGITVFVCTFLFLTKMYWTDESQNGTHFPDPVPVVKTSTSTTPEQPPTDVEVAKDFLMLPWSKKKEDAPKTQADTSVGNWVHTGEDKEGYALNTYLGAGPTPWLSLQSLQSTFVIRKPVVMQLRDPNGKVLSFMDDATFNAVTGDSTQYLETYPGSGTFSTTPMSKEDYKGFGDNCIAVRFAPYQGGEVSVSVGLRENPKQRRN